MRPLVAVEEGTGRGPRPLFNTGDHRSCCPSTRGHRVAQLLTSVSPVRRVPVVLLIMLAVCNAGQVFSQDASLFPPGGPAANQAPLTLKTLPPGGPAANQAPLTLKNGSFIYQEPMPSTELKLNDIVTVMVSINTRVASEGEVDNRKEARLAAELADWIKFDGGDLVPDPQSRGSPAIAGQWKTKYRADAELATRDSLTFSIAATVVDIRPNGNLVIEARRTIQNNDEIWEQCLTGTIRREDVTPDNKVQSEDVAELRIHKRESGQVRDAYRRGWLVKFFERWQPI
ncbi:MAG: hypothetical protein A2W31_12480 [Planctomycetes bacterium RBG_16_64_10]|nr:MAG: hypothetical protein A2W31_12480 [Planctomycetes bacterium RBG_16_64_10]